MPIVTSGLRCLATLVILLVNVLMWLVSAGVAMVVWSYGCLATGLVLMLLMTFILMICRNSMIPAVKRRQRSCLSMLVCRVILCRSAVVQFRPANNLAVVAMTCVLACRCCSVQRIFIFELEAIRVFHVSFSFSVSALIAWLFVVVGALCLWQG